MSLMLSKRTMLAGVACLLSLSPAHGQVPTDRPFAMRGVELGTSIDAFRQVPIPKDREGYSDPQAWCSNDTLPAGVRFTISEADRAAGLVECEWFSADTSFRTANLDQHWIDIGTGKGIPTFQFIEQGGELRLFRITFYANGEYYPGIYDALRRGYGAPRDKVEPFQTKSGSEFTSTTSVWSNPLSTIKLVERCGHLERYCLTYEHSELTKPYLQLQEQQASAAAQKI